MEREKPNEAILHVRGASDGSVWLCRYSQRLSWTHGCCYGRRGEGGTQGGSRAITRRSQKDRISPPEAGGGELMKGASHLFMGSSGRWSSGSLGLNGGFYLVSRCPVGRAGRRERSGMWIWCPGVQMRALGCTARQGLNNSCLRPEESVQELTQLSV